MWALATAIALVVSGLLIGSAPPAKAWPAEIPHPETVSADGLPTVQINGVVWAQALVGDTVYVGGNFTQARPAGTGSGSNIPRANILAYDVVTGELISSFAPNANAQVRSITPSTDGSRIYVAGDFTSIAGAPRNRIAAFDVASGQLVAGFSPNIGYHVYDVTVTDDVVYVGGNFLNVGSQYRGRLAAFDTSGNLLNWAPDAPDRQVWAVEVAPDRSKVVIAGAFETFNGTTDFGRGLVAVDAVSGEIVPFAATVPVRNGGPNGAVTELFTDGDLVYGSGYTFGRPSGTLEGVFAAEWDDGAIRWINDCHGDTHSVFVQQDVVYSAGHAHYCGNIDGFMQPNGGWDWYRGIANTKQVAGSVRTERLGYTNFEGQPRPDLLNWFPALSAGAYTGLEQGPWDVTGDDRYILMGGEFPSVNGVPQQGLVRFAVRDNAPNDQGPRLFNDTYPIKVRSFEPGNVTISWQGNRDRDDADLRYRLYRRTGGAGNGQLVHSRSLTAPWWDLPVMTFTDQSASGTGYEYRVQVDDGHNNFANSAWTPVAAAQPASDYLKTVLASEPDSLWRFGESTGSAVTTDTVGWRDAEVPATGVTLGEQGAIVGDTDTAAAFDGADTDSKIVSTTQDLTLPQVFSLEAWVRTAESDGGLIIGYNNRTTGAGRTDRHDRVLYMDTSGNLRFGVNPTDPVAIGPDQDFRDDEWHHVIGTLGPAGMKMYIDGALVDERADVTYARTGYVGNIRLGVGALNGFPGTDTDAGRRFEGSIDDAALYRRALPQDRVVAHYEASGRDAPPPANVAPVAEFTATPTGLSVEFDGTASDDPDGNIESWAWDFGDGTTSTDADTTSHVYATDDTYTVTLIVTDNDGEPSDPFTQDVTVTAPPANVAPVAEFTATPTGLSVEFDGTASDDPDGNIESWAWDFGDGTTSTDADTTSHVYATDDTYTVTLIVTDNDGEPSDPFTQDVTVTAPPANVAPVAEFTATPTGLSVEFDGTASDDPDGNIESWAWDFGDGTTSTDADTTSHVYATDDTYTVTLIVTDNDGEPSDPFTQDVTVAAGPGPVVFAADEFDRNVPSGWGNADIGGAWTTSGSGANYSVSGGAGQIVHGTSGSGRNAYLNSVSSANSDLTAQITVDKAATGGGTYVSVIGRRVTSPATAEYRMKLRYLSTGSMQAFLIRFSGGAETTLATVAPIPGLSVNAGDTLNVRFQVEGTDTTDLRGKVWKSGDTEPGSWLITDTASFGALQGPGGVGFATYLSGSATNAPTTVAIDNLNVVDPDAGPPPANVAPVAEFTATPTGLSVEFDGTASDDPDGNIESWAWDFGDGTTSTDADTTSHVYATDDTYTVTLIVTDNDGEPSDPFTQDVTVTAPPANVAPVAEFTATPTGLSVEFDGTASDDPDGNIESWAWDFGDGTTSTDADTTSHVYATDDTYTVSLIVTDNDGEPSDPFTQDVTVAAGPGPVVFAADEFDRNVPSGWGNADIGGAWTTSGSGANYSVSGGAGQIVHGTSGSGRNAYLNSVSSANSDLTAQITVDKAATGGGTYVSVIGRRVTSPATAEYRMKLRYLSTGSMQAFLIRFSGGAETTLATVAPIPGLSVNAGDTLNVRFQVEGTDTTDLRGKVWKSGDTEPGSWLITDTASFGALQGPGGVGFATYLSGSATNAPTTVAIDNLNVKNIQ